VTTDIEHFVSLDWTPDGSVAVTFVKSRRAVVPVRQISSVPGIKGATIVVGHGSGPRLITAAGRAVSDGGAREVFVQSSRNTALTKLTGRAALSLYVWNTGDPSGHPVDRILPYADGASPRALAELVGTIFDPDWFPAPLRVHDMADARPSRLESWLGLTPRWDRSGSKHRELVTAAWRSKPGSGQTFFDRVFHDFVGSGANPDAAERKVGRYFLRCVLSAWSERNTGGDLLFDPAVLFGRRAPRL
jgi:hypothetical protein